MAYKRPLSEDELTPKKNNKWNNKKKKTYSEPSFTINRKENIFHTKMDVEKADDRFTNYIVAILSNEEERIIYFINCILEYRDLIEEHFGFDNQYSYLQNVSDKEIINWIMDDYRKGMSCKESRLSEKQNANTGDIKEIEGEKFSPTKQDEIVEVGNLKINLALFEEEDKELAKEFIDNICLPE